MKKNYEFIAILFSIFFVVLSFLHLYYEYSNSIILNYFLNINKKKINVSYSDLTINTNFILIKDLNIKEKNKYSLKCKDCSFTFNFFEMILYWAKLKTPSINIFINMPEIHVYKNDEVVKQKTTINLEKLYDYWFYGDIVVNNGIFIYDTLQPIIFDIKMNNKYSNTINTSFQLKNIGEINAKIKKNKIIEINSSGLNIKLAGVNLIIDSLTSTLAIKKEINIKDAQLYNVILAQNDNYIKIPLLSIKNNFLTSNNIEINYKTYSLITNLTSNNIKEFKNIKLSGFIQNEKLKDLSVKLNDIEILSTSPLLNIKGNITVQNKIKNLTSNFLLNYNMEDKEGEINLNYDKNDEYVSIIGRIKDSIYSISGKMNGFIDSSLKYNKFLNNTKYLINFDIQGEHQQYSFKINSVINNEYLFNKKINKIILHAEGSNNSMNFHITDSNFVTAEGNILKKDKKLIPNVKISFFNFPSFIKLENIEYPKISGTLYSYIKKDTLKTDGKIRLLNQKKKANIISKITAKKIGKELYIGMDFEKFIVGDSSYKVKGFYINNENEKYLNFFVDSSEMNVKWVPNGFNMDFKFYYINFIKLQNIYSKLNFISDLDGKVLGELHIKKRKETEAKGQIRLIDGYYKYINKLYCDAEYCYKDNKHIVRNLELSSSENIIAKSDSFVISNDTLYGIITGNGVDAYYLPAAYDWLEDKIEGTFSYKMKLDGDFKHPYLKWELQGVNGDFWFFYFDALKLNIIYNNFTFYFNDIVLEKDKNYKITGDGLVANVFYKREDWYKNYDYKFNFNMEGKNVLYILPRLLPSIFKKSNAEGKLSLSFAGISDSMWFEEIKGYIKNGTLYPTMVVDKITNINGIITFDKYNNFIKFIDFTGRINNGNILIYNTYSVDTTNAYLKNIPPFYIDLEPLKTRLGYFFIKTDWIEVNIPSLMQSYKKCFIKLSSSYNLPNFLVGGPYPEANIVGKIYAKDMEFFYPPEPDETSEQNTLLDSLNYNLKLIATKNVWFRTTFASIKIEDNSILELKGKFIDSTLTLNGTINFPEGTINYMNKEFTLEQASLEFSGSDVLTTITGKAYHNYFDIEKGKEVRLEIRPYFVDPLSGRPVSRGKIENIRWKLISNEWTGLEHTNIAEKILSSSDYKQYAKDFVIGSMDNLFIQEYLQYLETNIKKTLPFVDFLRINPSILGNIFQQQNEENNTYDKSSFSPTTWSLLSNSRITIGKYLTNRWYITYTGTLLSKRLNYNNDYSLDMRHQFNLQFRFYKALSFNLQFLYDTETQESDKRFQVYWHFMIK